MLSCINSLGTAPKLAMALGYDTDDALARQSDD
jgi:hypothetical protein